jgi:lipopolysaccharide/colanic/teichoic acid biosynthesis glycosyltransferase
MTPALAPSSARRLIKRSLDVEFSLLALILISPLLAAIGLAVWRRHGRPVIFAQVRPGRQERPFRILKFRSMTNETDERGRLKPNAERITPLGRFLRSTSLDELPELLNVLRGEMSLVGPRPLLADYLEHYSARERLRHVVRPGMTGLAQVSGRNTLSWDEKLAYDIRYATSFTLWLDARIVLLTTLKLIRPSPGEVSSDGGEATPRGLTAPWKYGAASTSAEPRTEAVE